MKILVTGFASRQANPKVTARDVTMAWLLAEALRDAGHEVEHRDPSIEEQVEKEFDHAFVGLGPLHGVGTNRAYGSLAVILRMWQAHKLTLFIDDHEVGKISGGLRTILVDSEVRFCKPFWEGRRKEYDLAKQEPWFSWLLSGVQMLHEYEWPRLLLPAFSWCKPDRLSTLVPNASRTTVPIDLSAYLPQFKLKDPEVTERVWVTEETFASKWFTQTRPTLPTISLLSKPDPDDPLQIKRPHDDKLVQRYRNSWGVIHENFENGWWTSRMGYAAQARTLYITRWQAVEPLGQAYALLADLASNMDEKLRQDWVNAQVETFNQAISSKEQVKDLLSQILNPATEMVTT